MSTAQRRQEFRIPDPSRPGVDLIIRCLNPDCILTEKAHKDRFVRYGDLHGSSTTHRAVPAQQCQDPDCTLGFEGSPAVIYNVAARRCSRHDPNRAARNARRATKRAEKTAAGPSVPPVDLTLYTDYLSDAVILQEVRATIRSEIEQHQNEIEQHRRAIERLQDTDELLDRLDSSAGSAAS